MKIKTCALDGLALDWAVAKCEGCSNKLLVDVVMWKHIHQQGAFRFSTDWAQGGSIIDREGIATTPCYNGGTRNTGLDAWKADIHFKSGVMTLGELTEYGETALIAAMRCFVASRLGDEVEIPEELA